MTDREPLIPKHGGYRKLKNFQLAQLVYDVTVRFCERYVDKFSRTRDQMIQAARSGMQNIAEGSQASGTSRKTELKSPAMPHSCSSPWRAACSTVRSPRNRSLSKRGAVSPSGFTVSGLPGENFRFKEKYFPQIPALQLLINLGYRDLSAKLTFNLVNGGG